MGRGVRRRRRTVPHARTPGGRGRHRTPARRRVAALRRLVRRRAVRGRRRPHRGPPRRGRCRPRPVRRRDRARRCTTDRRGALRRPGTTRRPGAAGRAALEGTTALLTPTTTWHPTLEQVAADPIGANSRMGRYTNFANLLDMASLAVPAGFVDGLPFGVMLTGPAFSDRRLAALAAAFAAPDPRPAGRRGRTCAISR
ncbi:amidase family protein [Curtobacterium flaccumfaciens]|nr:amidase family protein [Curtobacterium flaccumfaciens]